MGRCRPFGGKQLISTPLNFAKFAFSEIAPDASIIPLSPLFVKGAFFSATPARFLAQWPACGKQANGSCSKARPHPPPAPRRERTSEGNSVRGPQAAGTAYKGKGAGLPAPFPKETTFSRLPSSVHSQYSRAAPFCQHHPAARHRKPHEGGLPRRPSRRRPPGLPSSQTKRPPGPEVPKPSPCRFRSARLPQCTPSVPPVSAAPPWPASGPARPPAPAGHSVSAPARGARLAHQATRRKGHARPASGPAA